MVQYSTRILNGFFLPAPPPKPPPETNFGTHVLEAPYLSKKTTKDNFVPERQERRRRDPGERDAPGPDPGAATGPSAPATG